MKQKYYFKLFWFWVRVPRFVFMRFNPTYTRTSISGLTPLAVDVAEYSEQIEKMVKEISSACGVPHKYWQRH
jgi:hypothetical protein